jgi:hypothetical protein
MQRDITGGLVRSSCLEYGRTMVVSKHYAYFVILQPIVDLLAVESATVDGSSPIAQQPT